MILTGKAKDDFLAYYGTGENYFKDTINDIEQYANIVDWFDSVEIFIITRPFMDAWAFDIKIGTKSLMIEKIIYPNDIDLLENRKEATKSAIIKSVEIYNNR